MYKVIFTFPPTYLRPTFLGGFIALITLYIDRAFPENSPFLCLEINSYQGSGKMLTLIKNDIGE